MTITIDKRWLAGIVAALLLGGWLLFDAVTESCGEWKDRSTVVTMESIHGVVSDDVYDLVQSQRPAGC